MNQNKLIKIAEAVLMGYWDDENQAGLAMNLSKEDIQEVRRLMHYNLNELEEMGSLKTA